jgi:hypothetical protein
MTDSATIAMANKLGADVEKTSIQRNLAAISVANFVVNGFEAPEPIRNRYVAANARYREAMNRLLAWQEARQPGGESEVTNSRQSIR